MILIIRLRFFYPIRSMEEKYIMKYNKLKGIAARVEPVLTQTHFCI